MCLPDEIFLLLYALSNPAGGTGMWKKWYESKYKYKVVKVHPASLEKGPHLLMACIYLHGRSACSPPLFPSSSQLLIALNNLFYKQSIIHVIVFNKVALLLLIVSFGIRGSGP